MGCSESLNASIKVKAILSTPYFKSRQTIHSTTIRTSLRDCCKEIISSNLSSEYHDSPISYRISCKGVNYTLNDNISLYDLRLSESDEISISAFISDPKKIEITLRILYTSPKEITLKVNNDSIIKELLENNKGFRIIRGDIELDPEETLNDYDIATKTKLLVLVDGFDCNEVQCWKIKRCGLIVEALCMNMDCMAYKQRVCINLGIGEFDICTELGQEITRDCICCGGALGKPTRYGFCHCEYILNPDSERVRVKDYTEGPLPSTDSLPVSVYKLS